MTTTRCECTTTVISNGRNLLVRCWLLDSQHVNRLKHWAVVDGKPYEWGNWHEQPHQEAR